MKEYAKKNWVNIAMLLIMLCYPFITNIAGDRRELLTNEINIAITSRKMEQMIIDATQNIAINSITTKLQSISTHMKTQTALARELLEKLHDHH